MEAAELIRDAVAQVARLRLACESDGGLRDAVASIKQLQARRFAGTYADVLAGAEHSAAARFFLDELYSDRDFAERDAQFSRIAGAVQRMFAQQVVSTAVALARLHQLTEELDHAMAQVWLERDGDPARRYILAWREVGRRDARENQLRVVLGIGEDMMRLTRTPGLRLMLRMMRGPASAAGLGSLQSFLETGFDTFGAMARRKGSAEAFLAIVRQRETALIAALFDAPAVACETDLQYTLGLAR